MAEKPLVSVIIPTYNGHKTIVQCLKTIVNQKTDFPYEIIIIDSSPEPVEPLIKPYFPQVRYVHSKQRLSSGEARNFGIQLALGEYVAFADQDQLCPPDWLAKLVKRLQKHSSFVGVGGAISNANASLSSWVLHLTEFSVCLPERKKRLRTVQNLPAMNSCYRRFVFDQVRFPDATGGEDVIFTNAITMRGWKLAYDPDIVVEHLTRSGWIPIFKHAFQLGRSQGALLCQHQEVRSSLFVRYPILLFINPLWRMMFGWIHCLQAGFPYVLLFTLLLPFVFIVYCIWAIGIYQGAKEFWKHRDSHTVD